MSNTRDALFYLSLFWLISLVICLVSLAVAGNPIAQAILTLFGLVALLLSVIVAISVVRDGL